MFALCWGSHKSKMTLDLAINKLQSWCNSSLNSLRDARWLLLLLLLLLLSSSSSLLLLLLLLSSSSIRMCSGSSCVANWFLMRRERVWQRNRIWRKWVHPENGVYHGLAQSNCSCFQKPTIICRKRHQHYVTADEVWKGATIQNLPQAWSVNHSF